MNERMLRSEFDSLMDEVLDNEELLFGIKADSCVVAKVTDFNIIKKEDIVTILANINTGGDY